MRMLRIDLNSLSKNTERFGLDMNKFTIYHHRNLVIDMKIDMVRLMRNYFRHLDMCTLENLREGLQ